MQHRCIQPSGPRALVTARGRGRADVAGELQGLAGLPFAVQLPGLNAERVRAAREGPEALAQLSPGAAVPGGVAGFLEHHHGVYAEQGVGGYRILVFDLGAPPSRNLSRMNAYAFAGVRDEIVEWVSTPDGALTSVIAAGLCEGPDHRPTRRRRGCTEYGVFSS